MERKKYLAHDFINGEYEEFETIEEAREYLKEGFLDPDDGYNPDMVHCRIYKLEETVTYNVLAKREDFTDEEWDEEYNPNFDEMWKHEFIKAKP